MPKVLQAAAAHLLDPQAQMSALTPFPTPHVCADTHKEPSLVWLPASPPQECTPLPLGEPVRWGLDVVPQPEMRQRVPGATQCDDRVSGRTAQVKMAGTVIFTSMMSLR